MKNLASIEAVSKAIDAMPAEIKDALKSSGGRHKPTGVVFEAGVSSDDCEISTLIVVPNGATDQQAKLADTYKNATVIEAKKSSKLKVASCIYSIVIDDARFPVLGVSNTVGADFPEQLDIIEVEVVKEHEIGGVIIPAGTKMLGARKAVA